jgi:hypothetical protein
MAKASTSPSSPSPRLLRDVSYSGFDEMTDLALATLA